MFGNDKKAPASSQQAGNSEEAMLRLSDDIGKMADRIGDMADRIGDMAERIGDMSERILETQRIQGKNMELMQETVTEAMGIMGKQMEASNTLLEMMAKKAVDIDFPGTKD